MYFQFQLLEFLPRKSCHGTTLFTLSLVNSCREIATLPAKGDIFPKYWDPQVEKAQVLQEIWSERNQENNDGWWTVMCIN